MRRTFGRFQSATIAASLLVMLAGLKPGVVMAAADAPSLVISQLKITSSSGQFVTLYNATDLALDMSRYQLEYFNNYDLGKATSSKLIALSGSLPPHSYYMVNDSSLQLCYQMAVDSVSLGFSSTAGMVELLSYEQSAPGFGVTSQLQDYAGWSKTAAVGAQTLPSGSTAFLQRQPFDAGNNPIVSMPGAGSWLAVQPDPANPCGLVAAGTSTPAPTSLNQLMLPLEPPATILPGASGDSAAPAAALPAADIGLMAPVLTELLPNPNGTGNDASDEFIELYNPNNAAFDLSGFSLQSGLASLHGYTFPAGAMLPSQAFKAFYPGTTGLSLSNSGGQAKLLDPFGNSVSVSEPYGAAKDGQAWARANGQWAWTTKPTPNAANVIQAPPAAKKSSKNIAAKASKAVAAKVSGSKGAAKKTAIGSLSDAPQQTPVHLGTLALVVLAALLYGAYEYRKDLANRFHQLGGYFKTGRRTGRSFTGRRSNRTGQRSWWRQNPFRTRPGPGNGQPRSGEQPELHAEPTVSGR